jgi:subtilisin family serine protease/subtilisin-like proprotein convertase family protein
MRFHSGLGTALVLLVGLVASVGAVADTATGSNNTDATIPDNDGSGVYRAVDMSHIPTGATVTGVEYRVRVVNVWVSDIELDLIAPNGTYQTIWHRGTGGSTDGGWDDDSDDDDDIYLGWRSTAALNGLDASGTWYLGAWDLVGGDEGYVDYIELRVHYELPQNNYAVYGQIANLSYGTDADGDGYYETFSFDVGIDPDVIPGPETVYLRIVSESTGQSWWSAQTYDIEGTAVDTRYFPFDETDFDGHINGNTDLDFTVELWDQAKSTKLAEDTTVSGEPVFADDYVPTVYAVYGQIANLSYGTDADGDGYYETFSFDVGIDPDVIPGPETVYLRIVSESTGQSWWSAQTYDIEGTAVDTRYFPFDETDFDGHINGNTDLDFTVELWDQAKSTKLAEDTTVSGEPVLADSFQGNQYAVYGRLESISYGQDADSDGYFETFNFLFAVDADAIPGPGTVKVKMICDTTGQSWWGSTPLTVTGTATDYAYYSFDETDFAGHLSGNTALSFSVEIWDEPGTVRLATDSTITNDPILADALDASDPSISISPPSLLLVQSQVSEPAAPASPLPGAGLTLEQAVEAGDVAVQPDILVVRLSPEQAVETQLRLLQSSAGDTAAAIEWKIPSAVAASDLSLPQEILGIRPFVAGQKRAAELAAKAVARTGLTSVNAISSPKEQAQVLDDMLEQTHPRGAEGLFYLRVKPGQDLFEMARRVEALPGVLYAHPAAIKTLNAAPNDPLYGRQWHLPLTKSDRAWDLIDNTLSDVRVAVIDTGVRLTHSDLADRTIHPRDVYLDDGDAYADNDPDNDDTDGHGTACAGIIGSIRDNNSLVAGMAPVTIIPVNTNCNGNICNDIDGIYWAVDHGADVISMSYGGYYVPSQADLDAFAYAEDNDVVMVASAGNGDRDADSHYPSAIPTVMSIGAVDAELRRVSEDYWSWGSNFGSTLDVVAPGQGDEGADGDSILTLGPRSNTEINKEFNGTSSSAPQVAALAALVRMVNPALTAAQVRQVIRDSARDGIGLPGEDTVGRDDYYGWGLIDAQAAIQLALGQTPGEGFTIANQGYSALVVQAPQPSIAAPWMTFDASFPLVVGPGEQAFVPVVVDFTAVDYGTTQLTLDIYSNDTANNPYPGGIAVTVVRDVIDIAEALDDPGLQWSSSSAARWEGQTLTTHDGEDAAQSGAIGHNQLSSLSTQVTGPGTLSFYWSVSSERGYDYLRVLVDGVVQAEISGEVDWEPQQLDTPAGQHDITFLYEKDGSVSSGADRAWLDQVAFSTSAGFTISPSRLDFSHTGGSGTVSVVGSGDWTAASRNRWITLVGPAAGSDSGSIAYEVAPTNLSSARAGAIAIAGELHDVYQEGAPPVLEIDPATSQIDGTGGTGSFTLTANQPWTAAPDVDWITLTAPGSGSTSTTMTFRVDANPLTQQRSGQILVNDIAHTVTQSAGAESIEFAPLSWIFPPSGGELDIQITANGSWTATETADWISFIGASSGTGNGSVRYSVAANASTESRTASIEISGRVHQVSQDAANSGIQIDPPSAAFAAAGGDGEISVTASQTWQATATVDWITLASPTGGSGNGTLSYSVAANSADVSRQGAIYVSGQTHVVRQQGVAGQPSQAVDGPARIDAMAGGNIRIPLSYYTTDGNAQLSSLGLRIHFDSGKLTWNGFSDILQQGLFAQASTPSADPSTNGGYDGDPATDSYVLISWVDMGGLWPGVSLPTELLTVAFTANGLAAGETTQIRCSASNTASGYEFASSPTRVTGTNLSIDIDDDGSVVLDQDLYLMLRYMVGFRGNDLIRGAIGSNAGRTSAEAIAGFLAALLATDLVDVDDNGLVRSDQDVFMLMRYAFGFRGADLTEGLLGSGAARSDAADIESYISGLYPADSGSNSVGVLSSSAPLQQVVADASSVYVPPGDSVTIGYSYSVSDENNQLAALGVRVHYDSSVLTWDGFKDLFSPGLFLSSSTPQEDAAENGGLDNDASTDRIVLLSWMNWGSGQWPNVALPLALFSSTFRTKDDFSGESQVNITFSQTAYGYDGAGDSVIISAVPLAEPGVRVQEIDLVTDESGDSGSFSVVLDSAPTASVAITLISSDTTEGQVDPVMISFGPSDWQNPRTVLVTGLSDCEDDGDVAYEIQLLVESADAAYDGLLVQPVGFVNLNTENDDCGFCWECLPSRGGWRAVIGR